MLRKAAIALIVFTGAAACSADAATPACQGAQCNTGAPGAPTFAGVATISPDKTGARARVTWPLAADDKTPAEQIRYRIYLSTRPGRALASAPVLVTEPGATSAYVGVAPSGVSHYVVVRAIDSDNNEDGNTQEKSVLATGDTTAPTFAGVKEARPESGASGAGVTVTWDPATDDRTAPEAIRYVVSNGTATLAIVEGKTTTTLSALGAGGAKSVFSVHAIDAADNVDANTKTVEVATGPDGAAPTFAGCANVESLGSKAIRVSWAEATDDVTTHWKMTYEVFLATATNGQTFATGPTKKVVGATSMVLTALAPSTTYYAVCRARDESDRTDTNTIEKSAQTTSNVIPPTFGGGTATLDATKREATITWTAATDDVTSPDKIVYVVYEAHGTAPMDYSATPRATTAPGATLVQLTDLPSRTTLRWVVRARDADYNEDLNYQETGGATNTSFALDVIPLFAQNCAVVGCHIAPVSMGGMSLSAFNAYDQIVNVTAGQKNTLKRILPSDSTNSYLYQKVTSAPGIVGQPMPAPGTGNILSTDEKEIMRTWIDQGAPRN